MTSHRQTWRATIRVRVRRALAALTTMPYRPGEIDPRPILGGTGARRPRPERRRPASHAAGSRSDLRPVRDLLPVDLAAASAPTEPIPLGEFALLSRTGYMELLAETHAINHPEPPSRARYAIDLGPLPVRPMPGWRGLARIRKEATP